VPKITTGHCFGARALLGVE